MTAKEQIDATIFLAGGLGYRIEGLTGRMGLPKQLLPVGGTSSLEQGIQACLGAWPECRQILVTSKRWGKIFSSRAAGVEIVVQENPRGNADGLALALNSVSCGHVLVMNADHLIGVSSDELRKLGEQHLKERNDATVLLEDIGNEAKPKFYWNYDCNQRLVGRSTNNGESGFAVGRFVGIFAVSVVWAKRSIEEERKNINVDDELKTTDVILNGIGRSSIGVMATAIMHLGINTVEEYDRLSNIVQR